MEAMLCELLYGRFQDLLLSLFAEIIAGHKRRPCVFVVWSVKVGRLL
jgi:hypothetical protein